MSSPYSLHRKIVGVRLFRLGFLPPGLYATEILAERKFKVIVTEFGNALRKTEYIPGKFPRIRFGDAWAKHLPGTLQAFAFILVTTARLVRRSLTGGRPALFVSHGIFEQTIVCLLSKILRVPYFCHIHEAYDRNEVRRFNVYWWLLGIEGWVLRGAKHLIFPEAGRARIYQERYHLDPKKISLVYNCPRKRSNPSGVDLRERYGLPSDSILMNYIGGIGSQNGLLEGIQALKHFEKLYFLVWGWSDAKTITQLKDTAFRFGVSHRVKFLGELKTDKWEAIAGCDISYCIYAPCDLRGRNVATASNKVMEAVACGVPVITSNHPDFKNLIEPMHLGVCTDISVKGITQAIRTLLSDPNLRSEISKSGRLWHEKELNYEHQFEPLIQKFNDFTHA